MLFPIDIFLLRSYFSILIIYCLLSIQLIILIFFLLINFTTLQLLSSTFIFDIISFKKYETYSILHPILIAIFRKWAIINTAITKKLHFLPIKRFPILIFALSYKTIIFIIICTNSI